MWYAMMETLCKTS